jgi:hypothetical protein
MIARMLHIFLRLDAFLLGHNLRHVGFYNCIHLVLRVDITGAELANYGVDGDRLNAVFADLRYVRPRM